MNAESFTKLLQLSISPLALISGAALFLLSITNRLGRSIDRARNIVDDAGEIHPISPHMKEQLRVLTKRSALLRNSVFCTASSIFLSNLMVLGLFLRLFLGWALEPVILILFFLSIVSLSVSLIYFFLDVSLALHALNVEVDNCINKGA